ncbi:MAG: CAP domain-containing protein [Lachnospiraceae bacterium]|nr:CAP domain-containing protein [Lachnospiraceae bacterium]
MKKQTLISLISMGVLAGAVICGSFVFRNHESGIDDGASVRTAQDIAADEVIFLDDEALAAADSSNESASLRSDALRAYNLVNEERESAGLTDLTWDSNLESTADVRAEEASRSFSHTRPNGTQWYTVNSEIMGGENLAWGQTSASQVVKEWMNSPAHRDNILYPDFNDVAISLYQTDDGTNYWALEFGY